MGKKENRFGTFGFDLDFLHKYDSILVLKRGDAQIVISPKYQGKVFTSTAAGDSGASFGWVNYKAFDSEPGTLTAYRGPI